VDLEAGASSARECTGLPIGKPISCKIETIMWRSAAVQYETKLGSCAASCIKNKPKPETAQGLAAGCLWAGRCR
jgi:hypothetical protein